MRQPDIGVTGIGMLSALGRGLAENWSAVLAGRNGHQRLSGIGPACERPLSAALLSDDQWQRLIATSLQVDPAVALAAAVARDALEESGCLPVDLGLVVGTSNGSLHSRRAFRAAGRASPADRHALLRRSAVDQLAPELAAVLGLQGPVATMSTACASSTHALGLALGWLREGRVEHALVVGVDVVLPMVAAGFEALGVLARGACAPFSTPVGMSLGEGAAAWVLTRNPAPERVRVWIRGYGCSADAVHPTAPDPTGRGISRSLTAALSDASLSAEAIDLYSAQGTGTEANDAAETLAVRQTLGPEVPVTSGKGHLGHCQGAGGLLEASLVIAGMDAGLLPPTANHQEPRRLAPPDVVHGPPRPGPLDVALKHSAAFGGANATVVLGRHPGSSAPRPAWGSWGLTTTAVLRGVPDGVAPQTPVRIGRVRLGTLDPTGRLLVTVVSRALPADADHRWGLLASAPGLQAAAGTAWQESIARKAASGRNFSRLVRNAGAGAACLALQLQGPTATICSGPASGLVALIHGLDLLRAQPDTPGLVVAGADEVGPNTRTRHALDSAPLEPPVNAAAAVALERDAGVRILGTGLAGAGALVRALTDALSTRPVPVERVWSASPGHPAQDRQERTALVAAGLGKVPHCRPSSGRGHAEATDALLAVVEAVEAIRGGEVACGLVIAVTPGGCATCVLLGAEG